MASNVLHRRHMDTMDIMGHGPWTSHGPWAMDHGPCFIVHGPWTPDMDHEASEPRARSLGPRGSGLWTMDTMDTMDTTDTMDTMNTRDITTTTTITSLRTTATGTMCTEGLLMRPGLS